MMTAVKTKSFIMPFVIHSFCALGLMSMILSGCTDDQNESESEETSQVSQDQGMQCVVTEIDCPNACSFGTGIRGESCSDSDSCECGLFCDDGQCAPYRRPYQGCRCPDEQSPTLDFTQSCDANTEGVSCNDLNPCTIDDRCDNGVCKGDPTPYPASCDDGNSCTTGDVCAGSVCQGQEKADGSYCDDQNLCTEQDRCLAGQCEGRSIDCSSSGDQCNLGVCDRMTGECSAQAKPTGIECDDGNYCTLNDRCEAGSCVASERVDCQAEETQCLRAFCDPLSGACLREARADGIYCDSDQSACTEESCQDGECVNEYTVNCGELCNDGICDPLTGRCTGQPLPDGTSCDDQDECTQNSTCRGGICFIEALLCACDNRDEGDLCDDGNECTLESRCNENGECVSIAFVEEGVSCEQDGNLCTVGGQCDGQGACEAETDTDCSSAFEGEIGPCQTVQCASETGECELTSIQDGTVCDTGDICDEQGVCQAGVCVASPKDCSAYNTACAEGVCSATTGFCSVVPFPSGTPCEDGNLCTGASRCSLIDREMQCVTEVEINLCDACAGRSAGDSCDDGNECTLESNCVQRGQALVCLGPNKECDPDDFEGELDNCQSLVCEPQTGDCLPQRMPIGSICDDHNLCTIGDRCQRAENGQISCYGFDLQSEEVQCVDGGELLLNSTAVDQSADDQGLVDQCTDLQTGQGSDNPHLLDDLVPGDQHARLLSSLSRDRTQDWYAVNLRANEHLNLRVTDRCNLDMPVIVSLLNATATRDLSTAQRFASRSNASQLSIDITETATYLVKVDLGRSLAIDEMSLPYVLHIDQWSNTPCSESTDCCEEEICRVNDDEEAGLCDLSILREEPLNHSHSNATRLLFLGTKQSKRIGELSDRFENDWFKVRLQANHVYEFSTQGYCGQLIDTKLSLYQDPTQQAISVNDNRNDQLGNTLMGSSKITGVIPEETADYYLKVESGQTTSNEVFAYYRLTAEDISCSPNEGSSACSCAEQRCQSIAADGSGQCIPRFSENEPNHDADSARLNSNNAILDTPFIGHIDRVGDRDIYLLDLPVGRFSVATNTYCDQQGMNTAIRVMDLSGLTLAEDSDSGTGRLALIDEVEVAIAQQYLIEVTGEGGSTGAYQLMVSTLSLGDVGQPVDGQCNVDSDCLCNDLVCSSAEDTFGTCIPRQQETEPNEQRFEASRIEIEDRITGDLTTLDDIDTYQLELGQEWLGESIIFILDPACDGLGLEAELKVFDESGSELVRGVAWQDGHLLATPSLTINQAQTYYIQVNGRIASRGQYVLSTEVVQVETYQPLDERLCFTDAQCLCPELRCNAAINSQGQCLPREVNELEPNDEMALARAVLFDDSQHAKVVGSLSSLEDQDFYRIAIGQELLWQRYTISIENICEQPEIPISKLSLFDPQGILLFEQEGTAEAGAKIDRWVISSQGTYTIQVEYADQATVSPHRMYRLLIKPEEECDAEFEVPEGMIVDHCACEDLSCVSTNNDGLGQCLLQSELTIEREPNSLPTLPMRLSAENQDYRGSQLYGRIDELGDTDYYRFAFGTQQRGGLYRIETQAFCNQYPLPLSRQVTQAPGQSVILSENARGESLSDMQRVSLGSGIIRAEGPLPLTLNVSLAPEDGVDVPNTGEYRLNIEPLTCEVNADCLCDSVTCQEGECRIAHDEQEPNDQLELATAIVDQNIAQLEETVVSGFIGAITANQVIDIKDYWLIPNIDVPANTQVSLRIRPQAFCEAPLTSVFIGLSYKNEADPDLAVYESINLIMNEDENGSYYEASLNRSGAHIVEVAWQNEIGPYELNLSLTTSNP